MDNPVFIGLLPAGNLYEQAIGCDICHNLWDVPSEYVRLMSGHVDGPCPKCGNKVLSLGYPRQKDSGEGRTPIDPNNLPDGMDFIPPDSRFD